MVHRRSSFLSSLLTHIDQWLLWLRVTPVVYHLLSKYYGVETCSLSACRSVCLIHTPTFQTHMHTYIHTYLHTLSRACVYMYMPISICSRTFTYCCKCRLYLLTHTHTHTHPHSLTHSLSHSRDHTHTHSHTHIDTHSLTHLITHAIIHTYTHTSTQNLR